MFIDFYTSDAKDNSIIAYGDTAVRKRHFKISYKKAGYHCFKRVDFPYLYLGERKTLEEAKDLCFAYAVGVPTPFFFTCGQQHSHKVDGGADWNKNSVLQVIAKDEDAARSKVFEMFGPKWSHSYTEETISMEYYPGGICAIIYA